ncbi:MaoC family dehydratase [Pygmaiobacter massiliensis]|uniref:MaoC family dehydratase n=1 Tax=Pygmaiobacter massiliensis TaxID=1917873 RepID=UPI0028A14932|nr:MaoC family dehydratase [Pygmaiobacter massiliensis]
MNLKVGQTASFGKTISESDVYGFAGIIGDFNSIHINQVEAEKSIFGERIAHGFLSGGLISTAIGVYLPGPGTIYKSQSMNFRRPVKIGDTITATVAITEIINKEKGLYRLETTATNQSGEIVIDGEAVVKYLG